LDAAAPAQFYVIRGPTAEAVLQREEALTKRLEPMIEKRLITGYHAVSSWVPSLAAQREHRHLVQEKLLNDGGPLDMLAQELGEGGKWASRSREGLVASASHLSPDQFFESPSSEPVRPPTPASSFCGELKKIPWQLCSKPPADSKEFSGLTK
jgi:predicted exporter